MSSTCEVAQTGLMPKAVLLSQLSGAVLACSLYTSVKNHGFAD